MVMDSPDGARIPIGTFRKLLERNSGSGEGASRKAATNIVRGVPACVASQLGEGARWGEGRNGERTDRCASTLAADGMGFRTSDSGPPVYWRKERHEEPTDLCASEPAGHCQRVGAEDERGIQSPDRRSSNSRKRRPTSSSL